MITDQQWVEMLWAAEEWRYLTIVLSREVMDWSAWNRATSKADLDSWLMWRFDLDAVTAREVSNYSMELNAFVRGSSVRWVGTRVLPEPTFDKYPEITVENVLRKDYGQKEPDASVV
jgi:hypothetical protein